MENIQELMNVLPNGSIEEIKARNDDERQALFEKYQTLYPNAYVSDWFLLNIRREEKSEKPCKDCKGYPCGKTSNKGVRFEVAEEFGTLDIRYKFCAYATAAKRQAAANRRFNLAKIPPMYIGKTFADYQIDASNKNAVGMTKHFDSIYIFGSPGTGKTFLAAIKAQELLKQGKSVIFGDVPSLLDQLKGTFDQNSESTLEELMKTLSEVDVLVLDDLGTETPTEWAVERLYLIVNNRYNASKPIIVTSNYDTDTAANRLNSPKNAPKGVTGSRIISRLSQMCKIVKISGDDKRLNFKTSDNARR